MNKLIKLTSLTLSAASLFLASMAQDVKPKSKDEKSQEIVIRKKGGTNEKMTIVVDGDNVTVNGKPMDDFKAADVTIFKRNAPSFDVAPHVRVFRGPAEDFDGDDMEYAMPPAGNNAFLGVMTEKADGGVKVKEVTKESAAEKAGLQKEDIITKVGTTAVTSPEELVHAINGYKPNDKADITYTRNGKENKTTATLGEGKPGNFNFNFNNRDFNFAMPEAPDAPMPPMGNFNFHFDRKPKIGLQIQDLEEGKGVKVKDVDDDSPASKAGMKEGDIIMQLNGKDIEGVDDLRDDLKDVNDGDTVKLSYKRDGKSDTAEIKIPKKLKSADL